MSGINKWCRVCKGRGAILANPRLSSTTPPDEPEYYEICHLCEDDILAAIKKAIQAEIATTQTKENQND